MALNKLNHIYGEPLVVSSLNTTGNAVIDGALTVLGTSNFVGAITFGNVSNEELQFLDGLTSNIQAQLNGKITALQVDANYAALSGATFTGAVSATGLTLTNALTIANGGTGLTATTKGGIFVGNSTTSFTNLTVGLDGYLLTADSAQTTGVKWAAAPVSLPTQTSNSGKYLTTDGTTASWVALGSSIPTQTGNAGKFLTTDATTASWTTLTASNLTGGTLSSTILGNSNVFIGTTSVALNRATANLGLTGISSVVFPGSTSGTTTVQASAVAGTTTFTLPATTGTADLVGNTFFVGTTSIANNRASAAQTLTGVSIDGNAATATNGLTTGNYNSYAPTLTGGGASGTWGINVTGNAATATTATTTSGNAATATSSGFSTFLNSAVSSTAAGNIGARINSGFWEQSAPTTANGWPVTGSWYHLISSTHSTTSNYYALQIAGSFFDNNNFYIRAVNGGGGAWTPIITGVGGQTIAGNLTLSGTLTINSDARLKENLTPLTGALDKVKALTGYNYNRIGSETLEMGVVAQEVQKVAPELVLEDSEGTLSVSYQNMVALLIEAVKEQSAEIAALKEQVEELRG